MPVTHPTTRVAGGANRLCPEQPARVGLGLLAVASALVLVSHPPQAKAGRQVVSTYPSSIEWVALPQADIGLTAAPAVTAPTRVTGSPPEDRDPMVVATALIVHHRLVILSLRGGLYGP